ncbi:MAG TPA: M20 family metallopeptidase [Actinomycetes bacterium]
MAGDVKERVRRRIGDSRGELVALSRRIHGAPELAFQEERACGWLCEALAEVGFAVEAGAYGLPTAFTARAGSGPLRLVVCAEYDALPDVGHACGHNLIAAMAVGAGLGLAAVADDLGIEVTVLGTPAEESGGGKVIMLERGAFADAHAAMMVHPAPFELAAMPVIASTQFDVHYTGKEAHAAAYPDLGINAADALVVAQAGIGLLRQHLRPSDRVHGIVTKGGDAPNIVPARTSARYMVRAATLEDLAEVRAKVLRCFEAGALATGATLEVTADQRPYAEMRHDPDLLAAYRRNVEALGRRPVDDDGGRRMPVSTDMGNVSRALPAIHPSISIDSLPAVNHTREFTAHCVSPAAEQALLDGAVAMAWTAVDAATDEPLRARLLAASS